MSKKPAWREYSEILFVALFLALFIRGFVIEAYKIPSGSMLNTLLIGDRVLVNKFTYGIRIPFTEKTIVEFNKPEINDVIMFTYPVDPSYVYVKRIVGKAGDVVEMRNKVFYRNNQTVDEPFAINNSPYTDYQRDNFGPITVPEGQYFVMGDNRDHSRDSRYWGFVDRSKIIGKAWRIHWSWGNSEADAGTSEYPAVGARWGRLGKLVE